jgi:hypothetical protein
MGDDVTPAQVKAAIERIEERSAMARFRGVSEGLDEAARILTEALAASEAEAAEPTHDDGRKVVRVSAATFAKWPSPISYPREIEEAGPGLWRVIEIRYTGLESVHDLTVVPDLLRSRLGHARNRRARATAERKTPPG